MFDRIVNRLTLSPLSIVVHGYSEWHNTLPTASAFTPCIKQPDRSSRERCARVHFYQVSSLRTMIQLAIKGGRHPILENVQAVGSFVANDAYACDSSTFQIVQGPKYVLFVITGS